MYWCRYFLEIRDGMLVINNEIQNPNRGTIQHAYWIEFEKIII